MSEAEYEFNKPSDDDIDSEDCGSSHELDVEASCSLSSTSKNVCYKSVRNLSLSTSYGVSLLSVLKVLTSSDLYQLKKREKNEE